MYYIRALGVVAYQGINIMFIYNFAIKIKTLSFKLVGALFDAAAC
jgi:hypothetical protein